MEELLYDVILHTMIGKRRGTLTATILDGAFQGELYLLNHSEQLTGCIHADGSCELSGVLHTLSRQIPFTASGQIQREALKLTLHDGKNTYRLTGITAIKENR